MKRMISLLLAAVMVISLAACSGKAESTVTTQETAAQTAATEEVKPLPYEGVKLKVWMAPMQRDDIDGPFWEKQFAKFKEETGAEVECEIVGWGDMSAKYVTGFMAGDAADIIYTYDSLLYDLISGGFLLDVTDYWTEEEIANENYWDSSVIAGKHYTIPFAGGASYRCYTYNMDILNACGVTEIPKNWEELLDVCEKVKAGNPDVYPILLPLSGNVNAASTFITFLYQCGGSTVNEAQDAYTFNTEFGKEALGFLQTLKDKEYLSTDCLGMSDSDCQDLFAEGKAAISVMGTPAAYLADSGFTWQCSTEMSKKENSGFDKVSNPLDKLVINANTANKEAAVALTKFMRRDDVMEEYCKDIYQNGQILKSYEKFVIPEEHMVDVFAHPERTYNDPILPQKNTVLENIVTNLQLFYMDSISADEALANMQAVGDKTLE